MLQIFRGNSIRDPDFTGTGHQAMGTTQVAAFYNQYTVVSSSIKLSALVSTSGSNLATCGNLVVYPSLLSTNVDSNIVDTAIEQPYSRWRMMGGAGFANQGYPAKMAHFMTTAKIWGVPPNAVSDGISSFSSTAANNPAQQWFWTCIFNSNDESTGITAYIQVELSYNVIWSQRNALVHS